MCCRQDGEPSLSVVLALARQRPRAADPGAGGAGSGSSQSTARQLGWFSLHLHLHMLVLDGVVEPLGEQVRFRSVAAPSEPQLQALLTRLIARMVRRLTKDGWLSQDTEPPSLDLEPRDVVDELAAALGAPSSAIASPTVPAPDSAPSPCARPRCHAPPRRSRLPAGSPPTCRVSCSPPFPLRGHRSPARPSSATGPSALPVRSHAQPSPSSASRSTPPVGSCSNSPTPSAMARLTWCSRRRTGWHDWPPSCPDRARISPGTLSSTWGVFAPNCRLRARVVPSPRGTAARKRHQGKVASRPDPPALNDDGLPIAPMTWAERLQGVFEIDITTCPNCGGRLRWIAGGRLRISPNRG